MQRLLGAVLGSQYNEHISVLAGLLRWSRSLVRHDLLERFGHIDLVESGQGDVCGDPVAHFTPVRIISASCVGIGQREGQLRQGPLQFGQLVYQLYGRYLLESLWFNGVADFCFRPVPSHGDFDEWMEGVENGRDDFSFLESVLI